MVESSAKVKPWRADIREAADKAMIASPDFCTLISGPLAVEIVFSLQRPKGHYRTGRNAAFLRDTAPVYPAGKPDVDKLTRAVFDSLTAIIWEDDAQVVKVDAIKRYAPRLERTGATITITELQRYFPCD